MSTVSVVAEQLEAALRTVPGVEVHVDPGANLSPPSLVLGLPSLIWESGCVGPTDARFIIYVIVDANERATEALWDLVTLVGDAIDSTSAVILRADPGAFRAQPQFPCYECLTEVGL